jgi:hypothetical protein
MVHDCLERPTTSDSVLRTDTTFQGGCAMFWNRCGPAAVAPNRTAKLDRCSAHTMTQKWGRAEQRLRNWAGNGHKLDRNAGVGPNTDAGMGQSNDAGMGPSNDGKIGEELGRNWTEQ